MDLLKTLHIQNYRLFKDLTIEKLGQVNLIAGKNNSGKTALLEALRIRASSPNVSSVLNNIQLLRGELVRTSDVQSYQSLFFNRQLSTDKLDTIKINDFEITHSFSKSNNFHLFQCKKDISNRLSANISADEPIDGVIYVPFSIDSQHNTQFWESISLTSSENDVVQILQLIEPKITTIRVENGKAKVLLNDNPQPFFLKSFGDGLNRLLTLALALVNSKGKMLLIDEFEVGLHHSVQEKLWKVIFEYAKEWKIQIFVTTHSEDSLKAFYDIGSTPQYQDMANYVSLKRKKNGDIEAVNFDLDEIETALLGNIEIR